MFSQRERYRGLLRQVDPAHQVLELLLGSQPGKIWVAVDREQQMRRTGLVGILQPLERFPLPTKYGIRLRDLHCGRHALHAILDVSKNLLGLWRPAKVRQVVSDLGSIPRILRHFKSFLRLRQSLLIHTGGVIYP